MASNGSIKSYCRACTSVYSSTKRHIVVGFVLDIYYITWGKERSIYGGCKVTHFRLIYCSPELPSTISNSLTFRRTAKSYCFFTKYSACFYLVFSVLNYYRLCFVVCVRVIPSYNYLIRSCFTACSFKGKLSFNNITS